MDKEECETVNIRKSDSEEGKNSSEYEEDDHILNRVIPSKRHQTMMMMIIENFARGVQSEARCAKSEKACWNIFFDNEMLDAILRHTNSRIRVKIADCQDPTKNSYMKECDHNELIPFIGLLCIAEVQKLGRKNLSDLWA
ncbi:hypothetical protein WA026_009031 [Henosepilachna vigintioctopunctata]|uniref:PiggyBac transposable element-derived protein domain-containing protein n=1 Tax=Henosepilachna vigintioctopunctata TaxID=420089 RepID=A0AAW1UMQ2_9CUCU